MRPKLALAALALCAPPLVPAVAAQLCAHEKARYFPAFDHELPPIRKCVSVITILDVVIRVAGRACPSARVWAEAHGECLHDPGLGKRCQDLGMIPVHFATCACSTTTPGIFQISTCECRATGWGGLLPTAGTIDCP